MRLGLSLGLSSGQGGAAVPNFYVDSVGGSDANDGSEGSPFQTLSKTVTEINSFGSGCYVKLVGGSTWRESFVPTPDNLRIEWDGTGTPPVITGFDVQTTWVDDTATVAGRWYKDVTHNSSGSNRQVVIENSVLMNRVASAAAVTTAGQYYSADCGTANPIRVYINVGAENPNLSGKVYEVTTRLNAVKMNDGCTITGVVARGAISNNGPLEVGTGSSVSRCVMAFGTKHNFLIEDGTLEDCVVYESDAPTSSEPTNTLGVAYAIDATGLSATLRRVFAKTTRAGTFMLAHSSGATSTTHANITIDQCAADLAGSTGVDAGGQVIAVSNSAFFGTVTTPVLAYGHTSLSLTRVTGKIASDSNISNASSGQPLTVSQCGFVKTVTGGNGVFQTTGGQAISLANVSVDTVSGHFGDAVRWSSGTTGSLAVNDSLIVANNMTSIPADATYSGDGSTYGSRNIGPFATWKGTGYSLVSAMADWRTASGGDATSTASLAAYFTGTTSNGDFRQSGAQSGAGMTEHWNFNTRAIVAGPQEAWPTIPQTYAQAITYISDPEAWVF